MTIPLKAETAKTQALFLCTQGQKYHQLGDLPQAIALYTQSIAIYPTAESYASRGRAYSFQGKIKAAIHECKKAIAVDPSLGNPYNDIGTYLIKLGKIDEAECWLQKAKQATRYDVRHFPYMNLGRIYLSKGLMLQAMQEFQDALKIFPSEPTCWMTLQYLEQILH